MNYYSSCHIPSLNKEVRVNTITFGDYFELSSYIENKDWISSNECFNKICSKSINYIELTNIDKLYLLTYLKKTFFNPFIELAAKDKDGNSVTCEVRLKDVMDNIKKYNFDGFTLPKDLYYSDVSSICEETCKSIDEIKTHIDNNKILLFKVPSVIRGIPKVYLNCFDNTFFHFGKLLYMSNMNTLYKKIITLKRNYNFSLSEIYEMNPMELDKFLNTK